MNSINWYIEHSEEISDQDFSDNQILREINFGIENLKNWEINLSYFLLKLDKQLFSRNI